jgi:hypothetical protein
MTDPLVYWNVDDIRSDDAAATHPEPAWEDTLRARGP